MVLYKIVFIFARKKRRGNRELKLLEKMIECANKDFTNRRKYDECELQNTDDITITLEGKESG